MNIGIRTILLGVAVVLFLIAVFTDENYADLLALGLASFAAAWLVEDLGVSDRLARR